MTKSFIDNPSEYFGFDNYAAHRTLSRDEVEAAQLAEINIRLSSLKDKIKPLAILADEQNIISIDSLNDAVPLFFPHTIYKSYPEELLTAGRFDKMTEWISRLTTVDLSSIAGENYQTLDDWMDFMDEQTDLSILHSSGTMGRLSFFPRGKAEVEATHLNFQMRMNDNMGSNFRIGERPNGLVWMAHAGGRTAFMGGIRILTHTLCESEEDFYPLIPAMMSTDYHYYVMQCQNLKEQGTTEAPPPNDYVRMRVEEAMQIHADIPMLMERQLDTIATLKYKRHVSLYGSPLTLNGLVAAGLQRGMENMLMPGSHVRTGGGLKNNPAIPNMAAALKRFTGNDNVFCDVYGMTELSSSIASCTRGHFHIPPWVIAYVLDVETGEVLPREGIQKGRAAFFDFLISSYWGGVVTGDMIEVDWGQCSCGRNTPFILPTIERIEEMGDTKFIGKASQRARMAVFDNLSEGLGLEN